MYAATATTSAGGPCCSWRWPGLWRLLVCWQRLCYDGAALSGCWFTAIARRSAVSADA